MGGPPFERGKSPSTLVNSVPPLVGRTPELGLLERWLQEAAAGHPRVVLVQGEAGIGKTRFLQEVRSVAQRARMQMCFGRCYEDFALPYLPFVESLLPQLEQAPEETKQLLSADLESIGQLLHRASAIPPEPSPSGSSQADHEKLQLFLAVGHATVKLAQSWPTVFVIDDLHWADRLSLDMLDHLIFTVADMALREPVPLLIIGTNRPLEAEDRLARLISRIRREAICRTVTLGGLNELEVHELIGGLGLARPSHQLTATISEATRGNPLFVQEVLHHLLREDALQEQGGYLVTSADPADLQLPAQVTGAIVTRARDLSEATRKVLTLASFLGDSFSLRTLAVVSDMGEDDVLNCLEEGLRQRLLRSEGEIFQFAHPLIRHVHYHEPSALRRQRLHKQIAESLQRLYADSPDTHLLEIAHHLVRAGSAVQAEVIVEHARRAADRAFALFAWGEAAHYYQAALSAAESTDHLSIQDQAELHYRAGLAHYRDQDVGPGLHHYERAIEKYRLTGDIRGLAQALMEKTRTLTLTAVPLGALADVTPLEEVLSALGSREPALRGHIAAVISEAYRNGRQSEKAKEQAQQALAIGQELIDDHLCAYASFTLALAHINSLHVREALDGWENAVVYAQRAGDLIRESWALHRIPLALTLLGRFDEAEPIAARACESTRTSHDWSNYSLGLSHLASVAVVRGDFALAERRAHETMLMVSRSRYPWGGLRSLLALACARVSRGAWVEAEDALAALVEPARVFEDAGPIVRAFARVFGYLVRAHSDRIVEPLGPFAEELMKVVGTDTYSLAPLCALVELADLAAVPAIAELPSHALSRAAQRGVVFSSGWMFLIPRVLGNAASISQRWPIAEGHFSTAIEVATRVGARPELGRTYLDYARMLTAQGGFAQRGRAIELLQQANPIFIELGMQPFARRATQLAEALDVRMPSAPRRGTAYPDDLSEREVEVLVRLAQGQTGQEIAGDLVLGEHTVAAHLSNIFSKTKVRSETAAVVYTAENGLAAPVGHRHQIERTAEPGGTTPLLRIILVSDIASSATLLHRAGDARAHELIRTHNALIRQCLAAHHGDEVTHTGDGIEASFSSASGGVECAVAIQRALARHNREHPADAIQVRIGINAGEPIATEGRLFGTAVHTAFRICAHAQPGQILVSDVIYQLVAGKGFTLITRGRVSLKGLERIRLYEVAWGGGDA